MRELIEKLTGRKQSPESHEALSSIIFGSGITLNDLLGDINKDRLRVGLWPIKSESMPEAAMGLGTVLGFLLERWPSIRVYRLFAGLEGEPANYQWTIQKSQFGVDDWELEDLDENIAIWGNLETANGQYRLSLEVENDLIDEDAKNFKINADTLGNLILKLIPLAEEIADYLDAGQINPVAPVYEVAEKDDSKLQILLKQAFLWELHLFLNLWGKPWTNEEVESALHALVEAGSHCKHDFGAWLVSSSIARALIPIYAPVNELLLEKIGDVADTFTADPVSALILAPAAFIADDAIRAYGLLESSVEAYPENILNWLVLAELYRQSNEVSASIDALQRAIEADAVSVILYMRYAELVNFLHTNNLSLSLGAERNSPAGLSFVERLVFIDPEEEEGNLLAHEAAEAYQAALEIEPDNIEALYQFTAYMVNEGEEGGFWPQFAKLVKRDEEGEHIRSVVDLFYNVEDISKGIKILRDEISDQPDRVDLRASLAAAYLVDENEEAARKELEKANSMLAATSPLKAEIDRLLLATDDPDFEARIGEITDLVNAGNELSAEDVEYLEEILEETPSFVEGYVLLASAYLAWDEDDDALEVLLDGQKYAPADPEITLMLARVLWDSEAENLAFDYLNKGLANNPNHVGMLALTGKFLFEDGQDVAAKEFLSRAEALNPGDPVLKEARAYIARTLSDLEAE